MKVTMDLKLEMAKKYDTGQYKLMELCKLYDVGKDKIQYYYKLYKMWGESAFQDRDKVVYSREEKLEAIKNVLSGEKSCRQIALEKCMPNPHVVQDWLVFREGCKMLNIDIQIAKAYIKNDYELVLLLALQNDVNNIDKFLNDF